MKKHKKSENLKCFNFLLGFGFVIFNERESYLKAFNEDKHVLRNKQIHLRPTQTRKKMKETRLAASEASENYRPFSEFAHYYDSTATATLKSAYNVKYKGGKFPPGHPREPETNQFSSAYHIRKPTRDKFEGMYPMANPDRREPPHRFVSEKNIPLNYGAYRGDGIPMDYGHHPHHYGQYNPGYHPHGDYYDPRMMPPRPSMEESYHMGGGYPGGEGSYPRYPPKNKESYSANKKPVRGGPRAPYDGYPPERPRIPGYRYPPKGYGGHAYGGGEFYSQRDLAYKAEQMKHRPMREMREMRGEKKMRFRSDMNIARPMPRKGPRQGPPPGGNWRNHPHPSDQYDPYWPPYPHRQQMRDYDQRWKTPLATQNEFAEVEEEDDEPLQRVNAPF